ncbi:hypothetical protein Tco_0624647 [Tanacetum coccineum]|uniref:Uncharacterized protein n=1 Tax=Tanacetum coccineum TaxID=301880 RepID=A0ABQ4WEI4_9ASTR
MSITKEQHQALDDALVPREQRLRIGNCNYKLSTTFKPKEPSFQVALDVLSLTPFYQAFLISASVPAIYMHEFWAIKFEDPSFEEHILAFISELGYPGDIKSLFDVKYGAIIPDTLTNQAKKESDAYKTYHGFATGKVIPKPKYVQRSTREKTDQSPTTSPGANKGTSVSPGVPNVPIYGSEDEQISWKSSDKDDDDEVSLRKDDDDNANNEDDDGQDDDNEQTELDNDGDDFIHPKFFTHDEEERQDKEDKQEEGSDLRVQTPSYFESTDDEAYDEVTQGDNVEGEELDEEEINEEEKVNELYKDVNVNLERRDTKMTDAP